jgi:N-formylglutamate amidohydrolase
MTGKDTAMAESYDSQLAAEIARIRQFHGALIRIAGELTGLQQRLELCVEGSLKPLQIPL